MAVAKAEAMTGMTSPAAMKMRSRFSGVVPTSPTLSPSMRTFAPPVLSPSPSPRNAKYGSRHFCFVAFLKMQNISPCHFKFQYI